MDLRWNFASGRYASLVLQDVSAAGSCAQFGRVSRRSVGTFPHGVNGSASQALTPVRPKCPISARRIPDGAGYEFTAETVALLLQAAMKDVSRDA